MACKDKGEDGASNNSLCRIAVVIPARNEENYIGQTLASLARQRQPLRPYCTRRVIVVNDGSADRTAEMVRAFGAEVVEVPDRGYSAHGTPVLAKVLNYGLAKLDADGYGRTPRDFVMILGADHVLPPDYIATILETMESDGQLAVCSGQIEGERSVVPRGSGRVVRADFWRQVGFRYPENYGFETYLVVKAQQAGYKVRVLNGLVSKTQRKTGKNYKAGVYVSYGKSLRALGYSRLYSIARIGLILLKNPKGAMYMLRGYLSGDVVEYDPELRAYFGGIQHQRIKRYLASPARAFAGEPA